MSTIECTDEPLNLRESVTTISANARIDYILRFSKHAVLVIDDNTETYTQVGNEFLGSLSKDHNAAFVSLSAKLNDIQIRCRIIEQLFGSILFDPEQPLSVNVVKLAETKNEAITVVIANAEHLSVQLSHELCQLAAIAKKLNKTINVLLLGKTQAAKNLSLNKHLFENKVSILLASSGQLISWNSPLLKDKKNHFMIWGIITIAVLALCSALIFFMSSGDLISTPSHHEKFISLKEKPEHKQKEAFVKIEDPTVETILIEETSPSIETAAPIEIFNALITSDKMNDIPKDVNEQNNFELDKITSKVKSVKNAKPLNESDDINKNEGEALLTNQQIIHSKVNSDVNGKYYQSYFEGYVIQVGNFTKSDGFNSFIKTHSTTSLYGYKREVKGSVSYVVTTQVYKTIPQAKAAIKSLSEELSNREPWVKPIQAVNNEINLYKQSQ